MDDSVNANRPRRSGFTLIELLVVVAIIAILAALLLPALGRAKLQAMESTCLSNQKQMAVAWIEYANDNKDYLINMDPQNYDSGVVSWRYYDWNPALLIIPSGTSAQQIHLLELQASYQEAGFWPYAPNVNVLHCPADLRANSPVGPNIYTYAGTAPGYFAWGSYSGGGGLNGADASPLFKLKDIRHSSGRLVFVEENDPRGENEGSWDQNWQPDEEDSGASWHGNDSTFSFSDGHVESHHWVDPYFIAYAKSLDPNKYSGSITDPNISNSPHDVRYIFTAYANALNP
jgi:prepilin-type N-terminal cleavage/methylation domain-containing protein/prepilin-type processing-associated H-X9-DG protein